MIILVYPHDLGVGGSQLNAIEIAAATRDLGHEVLIFGQPGPMLDHVDRLGLEFVEAPPPHLRPTRSIVRALRDIAARRELDILHGYEWPPILEARMASIARTTTACVGTVMSMSVAPFIPTQVPLAVGTRQIAHVERAAGRSHVEVIEPPVDIDHNRFDPELGSRIREVYGISRESVLVATVSRLVPALKLEGLLCAISTLPDLGDNLTFLIAGGGPAEPEVARAAASANDRAGRSAVVLTGELQDPRPVYAAADIVLGMGGSVLRAMAFGKPVVVQGETGFWRRLTPESLESFLWAGWYGVGSAQSVGPQELSSQLKPLLLDSKLRQELGAFGRKVVEDRFSLQTAARAQLNVYRRAIGSGSASSLQLRHDVPAATRLVVHTMKRELTSRFVRRSVEDFNARPVAAVKPGGIT
jgi:glycosyltransferase involved in cell wall biosynthesis